MVFGKWEKQWKMCGNFDLNNFWASMIYEPSSATFQFPSAEKGVVVGGVYGHTCCTRPVDFPPPQSMDLCTYSFDPVIRLVVKNQWLRWKNPRVEWAKCIDRRDGGLHRGIKWTLWGLHIHIRINKNQKSKKIYMFWTIHSIGPVPLARQLIVWTSSAYVLDNVSSEWDKSPFAWDKAIGILGRLPTKLSSSLHRICQKSRATRFPLSFWLAPTTTRPKKI